MTSVAIARPYTKTGSICLDAVMYAAHLFGCGHIEYDAGIIRFIRDGKQYELPYLPGVIKTTAIFALVTGTHQQPGERKSDSGALLAQVAMTGKAA